MRHYRRAAAAILMAVTATAASQAIYVQSDVRTVPVARLAANLERELAANPKSPEVHLRLARLYGMAFAMNSDEVPVGGLTGPDGKPGEEVWFGYEPELVPHRPKVPAASRSAAAKEYLQKAVQHYKVAADLNPASLQARLGYGWTLEQSGDKKAAIAEYRRVIEAAWPKEQTSRGTMPGERYYTQETAGYLIPLLDPKTDAKEIAELRQRADRLRALPRAITPIAIPLVADATARSIVDLDAQVPFDADGSGLRRSWTWITRDAGWLVYDVTGQGKITSALQWFGNVTFWVFWNDGYEPLAALDDDRNGELQGRELRHLAIWRDTDGDGVSDPGEVKPLSAFGIVGISCRSVAGDGIFAAARSDAGVRFDNGKTRPTFDVILRPSFSVSAPPPD
jgi:tetratricopeptide (TPR) repeat protein